MPSFHVTRHAIERFALWERRRTGQRLAHNAARSALAAEIAAAWAGGRVREQAASAARLVRLASPRRYYAVVAPPRDPDSLPPDTLLVVTVRPEHPGVYGT